MKITSISKPSGVSLQDVATGSVVRRVGDNRPMLAAFSRPPYGGQSGRNYLVDLETGEYQRGSQFQQVVILSAELVVGADSTGGQAAYV